MAPVVLALSVARSYRHLGYGNRTRFFGKWLNAPSAVDTTAMAGSLHLLSRCLGGWDRGLVGFEFQGCDLRHLSARALGSDGIDADRYPSKQRGHVL
jgi:hypothetical protein